MTLHEMLQRSVFGYPDKIAIADARRSLTYMEYWAEVEGIAAGLRSMCNGEHPKVALLIPNRTEYATSLFGASRAGATVIPINVLYRADEVQYILNHGDVEVLITAESFRHLIDEVRPLCPQLRQVVVMDAQAARDGETRFEDICKLPPCPHPQRHADDIALMIYTSGTTGRPKGVMLTHQNQVLNAMVCVTCFESTSSDRYITALALSHCFGTMANIFTPACVGASSYFVERFVVGTLLQHIHEQRSTVFCGVPVMYNLLYTSPVDTQPDVSSLRLCVTGGAPIDARLRVEFEQRFDVPIGEIYGLTESSPMSVMNMAGHQRRPLSVGRPVPGVRVRIVDEDGRDLPDGEVGEVAIAGHNIMKGYWKNPEATAITVRNGWLMTGDLGRLDSDGYLYIVGRAKEMMIVAGHNVYPGEVERVIKQHPSVLEAVAYGVPDERAGEEVRAAVVLRPGMEATPRELRALCRKQLASYKVPHEVEVLDKFPTNTVGKISRLLLKERAMRQKGLSETEP